VADICLAVGLQGVGSFTTSFTRTYGISPTAYRAGFPSAATYALIPTCVLRVYGRPQHRTFREDAATPGTSVVDERFPPNREEQVIRIAHAQVWVHDQDEALTFYTKKVGMEVRADVTVPEMGSFRWVTVGPVGQPDVALVLMAIPGPPVVDAETAEQVRNLMAKGAVGAVFLATDDCRAAYRAEQPGSRVHRGARGAAVRDRRGLPRPVGQQHPLTQTHELTTSQRGFAPTGRPA
jgi:catechol 2,3-dioxygenase-like lactoylglutathione lyase family enzyme